MIYWQTGTHFYILVMDEVSNKNIDFYPQLTCFYIFTEHW